MTTFDRILHNELQRLVRFTLVFTSVTESEEEQIKIKTELSIESNYSQEICDEVKCAKAKFYHHTLAQNSERFISGIFLPHPIVCLRFCMGAIAFSHVMTLYILATA